LSIIRLNIQTTQTTLAKGKPFDADLFNDQSEAVSTDFGSLAFQWNNSLVPLFKLMADGSVDSSLNAYANGLDGSSMYVDATADTSALKIRYYNANRLRPKTVKEMLDELFGSVAVAGSRGLKGNKGDPGTPGSPGASSVTFTAFAPIATFITNATASTPTADAEFFVDFDQFSSKIDVYLSIVGKIAAGAYAGGVAAWASSTTAGAAGPNPPYSELGETLLALVELPIAGTAGVYVGYDNAVVSLVNPGGKKYVTITSFAGATTPASDTGAHTLNYRGLTLNIKNHV
jgi:hypothetical protein